jgi:hypothetical protein
MPTLETIGGVLAFLVYAYLLYRQNKIMEEQNRIMREQAGTPASASPKRTLRNYWPMVLMAMLTVATWSAVGSFFYFRKPVVVEKTVERPVPQPCPETGNAPSVVPVPKAKLFKKDEQIKTNPITPPNVQPPSTVINAPSGIGIGGGLVTNPTVNNFGPPPANFKFTEEVVTVLSGNVEKSMKVHITTDRSIPGAIVGIVFSGPVEMTQQDQPVLKGASISQMNWGQMASGENRQLMPNGWAVVINAPAAFLPGQELIVPVKSKTDVHVVSVSQVEARP